LNIGSNKEHQNFMKWLTLMISVISLLLKRKYKSLQNDYVQNETEHIYRKIINFQHFENFSDCSSREGLTKSWNRVFGKLIIWRNFGRIFKTKYS